MNLSNNYERLLIAAKAIGKEYPYYTPASFRVRFEEDNKVPTMCIDSRLVVRYNDKFVTSLNDTELKGVVLHECMHYISGHHKRYLENPHRKDIHFIIHNICQDIEINQHIDRNLLPKDCQLPEVYNLPEGKCYEEYLLMLLNQAKNLSQNMKGSKMPGQSEDDQNDPNQGDSKCGDVDCTGFEDSGNQDESTRRQLVSECEQSQAAHDKKAGKEHSFAEQMKKIEKIRYPWAKVFKSLITNRLSNRVNGYNYRTYHKPNKHLMGLNDKLVHGSYCDFKEHIDLVIGVDISGSMYGLVEKMYGVMKSIIDVEEIDITTTILECDTEVSKVIHNFELDKSDIKVGHGGGTDMGAISQYVQDQKWDPDLIIVMTDNETGWNPVLFRNKTIVLTTEVTDSCPYKQFLVSF